MATKSATKTAPKKTTEKTPSPDGTQAKKLAQLESDLKNLREVVRRLACGEIVTEEHRNEALSMIRAGWKWGD